MACLRVAAFWLKLQVQFDSFDAFLFFCRSVSDAFWFILIRFVGFYEDQHVIPNGPFNGFDHVQVQVCHIDYPVFLVQNFGVQFGKSYLL